MLRGNEEAITRNETTVNDDNDNDNNYDNNYDSDDNNVNENDNFSDDGLHHHERVRNDTEIELRQISSFVEIVGNEKLRTHPRLSASGNSSLCRLLFDRQQ